MKNISEMVIPECPARYADQPKWLTGSTKLDPSTCEKIRAWPPRTSPPRGTKHGDDGHPIDIPSAQRQCQEALERHTGPDSRCKRRRHAAGAERHRGIAENLKVRRDAGTGDRGQIAKIQRGECNETDTDTPGTATFTRSRWR